MAEFTHEELQSVLRRYVSEFERVKKVGIDFKQQIQQRDQTLANVNSELTQLKEMESILREEVQALKTHVNNFSQENTKLQRDNAILHEKVQINEMVEMQVKDLKDALIQERELNLALTQAQEEDEDSE